MRERRGPRLRLQVRREAIERGQSPRDTGLSTRTNRCLLAVSASAGSRQVGRPLLALQRDREVRRGESAVQLLTSLWPGASISVASRWARVRRRPLSAGEAQRSRPLQVTRAREPRARGSARGPLSRSGPLRGRSSRPRAGQARGARSCCGGCVRFWRSARGPPAVCPEARLVCAGYSADGRATPKMTVGPEGQGGVGEGRRSAGSSTRAPRRSPWRAGSLPRKVERLVAEALGGKAQVRILEDKPRPQGT
ncbi:hypothetical protein SANTM175S_03116 [Streptomyces antimycoticus]